MKRLKLGLLLIAAVTITAGCLGRRTDVSWADIHPLNTEQQELFVSYKTDLYVINPITGNLSDGDTREATWQIEGNEFGAEFYTSPIFLNNRGDERLMLVADYNNRMWLINYDRACFSNLVGSCLSAPPETPPIQLPGHTFADFAQDDERIYVPLSEHNVIAIKKGIFATGWDETDEDEYDRRDRETFDIAWEFETDRGVWAQPLLLDGVLYIPTMDHHLYAVDTETGEELWHIQLDGALASTPVVHNNRLYIGTFGRSLYEIPLNNGQPSEDTLVHIDVNGWVWNSPVIIDDMLYLADLGGYVHALDISQGLATAKDSPRSWSVNAKGGGIRAEPLVLDAPTVREGEEPDFPAEYEDGVVIVGTREGQVIWLNRATGEIIDRQEIGEEILADLVFIPPSDENEALVIVSTVKDNRALVAFFLNTRQQVWTYPS
ncbi:MAG: hypothetical protein CUN56_05270 [Phototrophicales bacterium]|nr:MAG: hypothetical protein CUN56_05270 [Phototrophicales bacterium]